MSQPISIGILKLKSVIRQQAQTHESPHVRLLISGRLARKQSIFDQWELEAMLRSKGLQPVQVQVRMSNYRLGEAQEWLVDACASSPTMAMRLAADLFCTPDSPVTYYTEVQ